MTITRRLLSAVLALFALTVSAIAQTPPVEPAYPWALVNYHRACIKDSFGTAPGRIGIAETARKYDNVYPNGDRKLNDEAELYGPSGDWSSFVVATDHAELTPSLASGRTIAGTTAFNPADAGAIKSAMLSSKETFHFGYFEMRIQVPPAASKGYWPAGWLTRGNAPPTNWWPPEVDIFEVPNNSGSASVDDGPGNSFHGIAGTPYRVLYDATNQWHSFRDGSDLSGGYHVFGLEWLPDPDGGDRWRWYLDGVLIRDIISAWAYSNGQPAGAAHLYLNLAYGGSWAGRNGINAAGLAPLKVDYIEACGP